MERTSKSGFPVDPVYDESKLTDFRPDEKLGRPGRYPFTRGVHPRVRVDRPSPMRPYAGERVSVGVNRFTAGGAEPSRPLRNLRSWKAPETCFTRSAMRFGPTPLFVRSAMRCGTYGAPVGSEIFDELSISGTEAKF